MPCGKANVQSANQPPNLEPDVPAIPKFHHPHEEAETEPGKQHDQRGLEKNSLGLRELPDGVKVEEGRREAYGVVYTTVGGNGGVGYEESASVGGTVEELARRTRAEAGIVTNRVGRA